MPVNAISNPAPYQPPPRSTIEVRPTRVRGTSAVPDTTSAAVTQAAARGGGGHRMMVFGPTVKYYGRIVPPWAGSGVPGIGGAGSEAAHRHYLFRTLRNASLGSVTGQMTVTDENGQSIDSYTVSTVVESNTTGSTVAPDSDRAEVLALLQAGYRPISEAVAAAAPTLSTQVSSASSVSSAIPMATAAPASATMVVVAPAASSTASTAYDASAYAAVATPTDSGAGAAEARRWVA